MAYNISARRDPSDFKAHGETRDSILFQYDQPLNYKWNIERTPKQLIPQQNEYSAKGNNVILFDIPNDHIYDFSTSSLEFTSRLVGTGGTYIRQHQGSWNLFSRMRHLANNKKVEEKSDYGDTYNLKWVFEADPATESSIGTNLYGIQTQAARNAWGASVTGTVFNTPVDMGFLRAGPFGAKFLKERHQLEITIQDPLVCLETDKTALNIFISNIKWNCYVMKDSLSRRNDFGAHQDGGGFEATIRSYIESGNLCVQYDSIDTFQNNAFAVMHDWVVSHRAEGVKGIYTIFRNDNDRANPLINNKLMSFPKHGVTSFQARYNGSYLPDRPCDCVGDAREAYHYYLNWVNSAKMAGFDTDLPDNPNVSLPDFNDNEFIIVSNLQPTNEKGFIGTISTLDHNMDVQLNVKFSAPPPAGTVAIHYIRYTTIAKIQRETTAVIIYE